MEKKEDKEKLESDLATIFYNFCLDTSLGQEQLAGEDWGRIDTIVNEGDYLIN